MSSTVDTMNEQMKQMTDLQQRGLEPMRAFGGLAVEVFEHMARQNYAVVGDMIDYSIRQTNLTMKGGSMSDTLSAQMAEGKAFAELMNRRVTEYADIVGTLGEKVSQAGNYAAATFKTA